MMTQHHMDYLDPEAENSSSLLKKTMRSAVTFP